MDIQIGRGMHIVGELSREDIPSSFVSLTNMGLKYVPFPDTRDSCCPLHCRLHSEDEALTLSPLVAKIKVNMVNFNF